MQLIVLFVGIILFFVLALAITNFIQRRKGNTTPHEVPPPAIDLGGGCCGAHEVCEKDSLIAAFLEKPEYFERRPPDFLRRWPGSKEKKEKKRSRIGNIRMQTCIPAIFFVSYESTVI